MSITLCGPLMHAHVKDCKTYPDLYRESYNRLKIHFLFNYIIHCIKDNMLTVTVKSFLFLLVNLTTRFIHKKCLFRYHWHAEIRPMHYSLYFFYDKYNHSCSYIREATRCIGLGCESAGWNGAWCFSGR